MPAMISFQGIHKYVEIFVSMRNNTTIASMRATAMNKEASPMVHVIVLRGGQGR